jgi:hypothetical protein
MLTTDTQATMGDLESKLTQAAANVIGSQLEQ